MRAKMIYIAGALLLLSGCRSKVAFGINRGRIQDSRTVIQTIISEPERQEALLEIVDAYKRDIRVIEKEAIVLRQEIVELNRVYATPREELEVRYNRLGELTEQLGHTVKMHSMSARALCSEDEWKQIAPKKSEVFHFTF